MFKLFYAFFRCGLFAYGGGAAMVPLIEHEIVDVLKLMSTTDFTDAYAIGQTLPGPITTKIAGLIGFRLGGIPGMLFAMLGIVLPSAVLMVLVFSVYQYHKDAKWITGLMRGLQPIVAIMILKLFLKTSSFIVSTSGVTIIEDVALLAISLLAAYFLLILNMNPIFVIALGMIIGLLFL